MRAVRYILCALALGAALAGCGVTGSDSGSGFGDSVDKARAAQAFSSLQSALVALSVMQADPSSAGPDTAAALQAKDPSHRYTTAPPSEAGMVQVVGGDPVMLVAMSDAGSQDGSATYVAAWRGSGTTMYYSGAAAPAYTSQPPSSPGWGSTVPQ